MFAIRYPIDMFLVSVAALGSKLQRYWLIFNQWVPAVIIVIRAYHFKDFAFYDSCVA